MKKSFDERSQTNLSLNPHHASTEHISVDIKSKFQWSNILQVINSLDFLIEYGSTTYIQPTSIYIAVGTTKGHVVVFNYLQAIKFVLTPELEENDSEYLSDLSVSSILFSSDLTMLVCGNVQGVITIWELNTSKPYFAIKPITLEERFQLKDGHLNLPIIRVDLIDNTKVVSVDSSGIINYHLGVKSLLAKSFNTQKIMGPNDVKESSKETFYDNSILPYGSSHQITDEIGFMAVITSLFMKVVSLKSMNNPNNLYIKTHFKIMKPKNLKPKFGCVNWFPCMQSGSGVTNARLAYSWDKYLYIAELDNSSFPDNFVDVINDLKDKDKSLPTLPMNKMCKMEHTSIINSLQWISLSLLLVFGADLTILYYEGGLNVINSEPLPILKPLNWDGNIKTVKNRIILLEPNNIKVGKTISWNEQLLELIKLGDYENALKAAWYFYTSNDQQLVLFNLPDKKTIASYLTKIMDGGIGNVKFSAPILEVYFKVASIIEYDMDDLFEAVDNELFFDSIEPFLVSGEIRMLSATILKQLVIYYTSQKKSLITEILCTIDVTFLDIDLSIHLFRENGLNDGIIFIYNYLLHDYSTPFNNFLQDLKPEVFLYLAYILTGRQYPIDQYIDYGYEEDARRQITQILFTPSDDECLFPNLTKLMHYNSFAMLSTLNEFFEDSSLNEGELNRQYIIDAILDIYASEKFLNQDKCNLSIFIGRNYPKYSQFLRLSDSILSQILDNLINYVTPFLRQDCELAIESLVSVFEPMNETKLIEKLTMGKFWSVLMGIYRNKHQWDKFLRIYLCHGEINLLLVDEIVAKHPVSSILEDNFEKLLNIDVVKVAKIIDKHLPQCHRSILKIKDKNLQYEYLKQLSNADLRIELIKLMIELEPTKVHDYLTSQNFTSNELKFLEKIVSDVPDLVLVYNMEKRYHESLDLILSSLKDQPDLFDLFVEVMCYIENENDDEYWIKLINILVAHHQKLISPAFKVISDKKFNDQLKFQSIINHFLNDIELTNVKEIIWEILVTYSYETEILSISSKILNASIHQNLMIIADGNKRGWPSVKYCTSCQKRFGEDDYLAWEAKECERLDLWGKKQGGERLILFKCGHGYHFDCLQRLGGNVCVLDL